MSDLIAPAPATPREILIEEFFVQWVSFGAGRTYGMLAKATKLPAHELIRHAKKFLWRERLTMVHSAANAKIHNELVESLADVNKRHISSLRTLQEKAMKFLENHSLDKPADAIKLIGMSIKMEREAYGLDKNSEQGRLQDLLEAKMERLLEEEPKQADVKSIKTEFPDPDEFDADEYKEPGGEDDQTT